MNCKQRYTNISRNLKVASLKKTNKIDKPPVLLSNKKKQTIFKPTMW